MHDEVTVYASILRDSLQDKWEVLKQILEITKEQENMLNEKEVDTDAFEELLTQKGLMIEKMQELDRGFNSVYSQVEPVLKANPNPYKSQILEMQNSIRVITECSVKIQALEQKNKEKFGNFVAKKRRDIRDFKVSNKTAVSYYQNMSNQHHQWQSYFVDQKK